MVKVSLDPIHPSLFLYSSVPCSPVLILKLNQWHLNDTQSKLQPRILPILLPLLSALVLCLILHKIYFINYKHCLSHSLLLTLRLSYSSTTYLSIHYHVPKHQSSPFISICWLQCMSFPNTCPLFNPWPLTIQYQSLPMQLHAVMLVPQRSNLLSNLQYVSHLNCHIIIPLLNSLVINHCQSHNNLQSSCFDGN